MAIKKKYKIKKISLLINNKLLEEKINFKIHSNEKNLFKQN